MAELPTKQELADVLRGPVDRSNFNELVEGIHSSFKTVDWASDFVRDLRESLDAAPEAEQSDLREKVGILQFALGDYPEAVEVLEHVKARKGAAHFLGRALLALNREEEALQALEAGRTSDEDLATDVSVVDALCRQRNAEAARELCERHAKTSPESPDWFYAMGRVLETEGVYDEAMAHYERAIERDPEHRGSLFRLALSSDLNGEDERAVELYERCASLKPTSVGALVNLGVLYEDRGQYGRAVS